MGINKAVKENGFISDILIISGPSGSGKGTIIDNLDANKFSRSVSATTRKPRSNEKDGVDYYFLSTEEFKKLIDEDGLFEWTEYGGKYYGTPRTQIDAIHKEGKVAVLDIDVNGAKNIKKIYPESVMVFLLLSSAKDQRDRLVGRKENTEEDIQRRLDRTKEELKCLDIFDRVYLNEFGKQKETAKKVLDYMCGLESPGCDYKSIAEKYFTDTDN